MFGQKSKGVFLDRTEYYTLAARTTSRPGGGLLVEEVKEFPATADAAEIRAFVGAKPSQLVQARCAVHPPRRFMRRVTLEAKQIKEPNYFRDLLIQQMRIEADKHVFQVLNSSDGTAYDVTRTFQREAIFCGAPKEEIAALQSQLLAAGIYPLSLELGSVATMGALSHYLMHRKSSTAVLVLELLQDAASVHIVSSNTLEATRSIASGFKAIYPVVQNELGLKDEESTRKLFFSNNFDFTTMGAQLVRRLARELQSAVGVFEVQNGQSISHVLLPVLPANLDWLRRSFSEALELPALELDFLSWLPAAGVALGPNVTSVRLDVRWLCLFSLMTNVLKGGARARS